MRRLALLLLLVAVPAVALAQADDAGIDVIDVSGPLDASALAFMADSIERAADEGQVLAVLQVDSRAVLDAPAHRRLLDMLASPPLPVAVWVGPAPAHAYGGAALLLVPPVEAAIAPGSMVGQVEPVVLGSGEPSPGGLPSGLDRAAVPAEESGLELQPTLRQYLQDLDGRTLDTAGGPVTLSTLTELGDGVTVREVTFHKPGLGTRFLRLAVAPEAAFFFLVVGLSIATFEFFALGPGVAAGVAALSLIPAGWGLVNLPVRWWALGLVVAGWATLTGGYQKGSAPALTVAGAVLLQAGGMTLIDGAGQLDPRWWLVLASVLAVLFFFTLAMPTVQRARLSTQTIGRDALVGRAGRALVDFDPDGLIEVGGARWRATAHREAGVGEGSEVIVTGVDGLYLEVEPLAGPDREK